MDLCNMLFPTFQPKQRVKPKRFSPYQNSFLIVNKPKKLRLFAHKSKPPRLLPSLSLSSHSFLHKSPCLKIDAGTLNFSSKPETPKPPPKARRHHMLPPINKLGAIKIETTQQSRQFCSVTSQHLLKYQEAKTNLAHVSFDSPLSGWSTLDNTI